MGTQSSSLKRYALTRLALVVPMVFILLTLVFLLMRVAPGNPVSAALGVYATPVFFLGLLAQLVFGTWLNLLPTSDQASPITQALMKTHTNIFFLDAIIDGNWSAFWDIVKHLILPATTLGIVYGGVFIRL